MTVSRIPNFRGHRALILHPADTNRAMLVEQLSRLGIETEEAWPISGIEPDNFDVIFFDADRRPECANGQTWAVKSPPLIAMTGTEAPGRLEAMLAVNPSAMLNKPLRREGVFKALVFAYHNHRRQRDLEGRLAFQHEQVRARSLVFKTILLVMRRCDVDEDEAYAALRSASMSCNQLVEAFAFTVMSDPDHHLQRIENEISKISARNKKNVI
jgi:AmiR/NasT family two-component response regulator